MERTSLVSTGRAQASAQSRSRKDECNRDGGRPTQEGPTDPPWRAPERIRSHRRMKGSARKETSWRREVPRHNLGQKAHRRTAAATSPAILANNGETTSAVPPSASTR